MIDSNLILYLPFDDPDGNTAYDFSSNRADATLDGASFSKDAIRGKSLSLDGGECVSNQAIPFSSDFTLCAYIQPSTSKIGWLLNFSGLNNFIEQWLDVVPGEWYHFVIVKKSGYLQVFLNFDRVYNANFSGTPQGLSINSDEIANPTAKVDEVRLYKKALSLSEIKSVTANTDVEYLIDGINFKEYGVEVSASSGLVGRLARKDALEVDWENYHGIAKDRKRKRFKERTIMLECFIAAESRSAFINQVNEFFELFDGDYTHRLSVLPDGMNTTKPLLYEVDLYDEADVTKTWGTYNKELMVGTFKLKLVEDDPVKMVLRHVSSASNSNLTIKFTSDKMIDIHWGDGTHMYNSHGTDVSLTHTYEKAGEYDIIISGVIEDIDSVESNAIVIWKILK